MARVVCGSPYVGLYQDVHCSQSRTYALPRVFEATRWGYGQLQRSKADRTGPGTSPPPPPPVPPSHSRRAPPPLLPPFFVSPCLLRPAGARASCTTRCFHECSRPRARRRPAPRSCASRRWPCSWRRWRAAPTRRPRRPAGCAPPATPTWPSAAWPWCACCCGPARGCTHRIMMCSGGARPSVPAFN